ncbi:MAG: hypothetical protein JXR40_10030 [Pontiellaceae bacterium]|nr:hypothetical protein [Pontiellaceae bacterium]
MIYNMEQAFNKARNSCAHSFETNPQIQLLVAQGLSRFGHQSEATIYCRKAIVLGAGEEAEEFLRHCEALQAAKENSSKKPLKAKSAALAYVPLMLLIALLISGGAFLSKSSLDYSNAWIVNGTLRSYTFSIDDESYSLSPGDVEKIKIGLGEHTLKMGTQPALSFTNDEPQIKQFLHKTLLVINPDDMALLALPKRTEDDQPDAIVYSHNGQVRTFKDIRLSRKGIERTSTPPPEKTGTALLFRPQTHEEMINKLQQINQPKVAEKYARNALEMNPLTKEATLLIPLAVKTMDDQQTLAFLKKQLSRIPSLLDWHLYYQEYMQIHHPEFDLEAEYYERCQQNISEPESRYLLARVAIDRSLAYQFYEASDQDYGMDGMGFFAIAHDLYIRGSFAQAQPYIQKALEHDPSRKLFRELNEHILLAQRNYKRLAEEFLQTNPSNLSDETAKKAVVYLTSAGFHQEAVETITNRAKEGSAQYARLNALRLYAIGNISGYLLNLRAANEAHADFEEYLYEGKIESADEALSSLDAATWQDHLLLYCAAMQQGNTVLAEQNLERATSTLSEEIFVQQQIIDLLSNAESVTPESIQKLDIEAPDKALLLTAFVWSNPEQNASFRALARLYNFTPTYPQLFIEELLRD